MGFEFVAIAILADYMYFYTLARFRQYMLNCAKSSTSQYLDVEFNQLSEMV